MWGLSMDEKYIALTQEWHTKGWNAHQEEVDELKHQKSLQELEINQISQANQEWQRISSELRKRIDELENQVQSARVLCETACELLDDYAHQDAMVILDDLEEALRGEHETR